jgi:large subunit ribosomal protein L30
VADKNLKMIRIKWVRSGIGFTLHQKTIVRSLGLSKLNHTVLRPDTPQIRGIVASVPHLLEIVSDPAAPAWASIPEYTIQAPAMAPAAPPQPAETAPSAGEVAATEEMGHDAAVAPAGATEIKSAEAGQEQESSPKASDPAETG